MSEYEWCIVCKAQENKYVPPIALMAMGNLDTMSVKISAYCRAHLSEICGCYQRNELYFTETHHHVDEILIRAIPSGLLDEASNSLTDGTMIQVWTSVSDSSQSW